MTAAQADYLRERGIDPWSLRWADAGALGYSERERTEAAVLPDGRVLFADAKVGGRVVELRARRGA